MTKLKFSLYGSIVDPVKVAEFVKRVELAAQNCDDYNMSEELGNMLQEIEQTKMYHPKMLWIVETAESKLSAKDDGLSCFD